MEMSQIPEVVGQTIDTIASKLQVPAQKLLDVAVKGTRIEGIVGIPFNVALLLGCIWLSKLIVTKWKTFVYDNDLEVLSGFGLVFLFFLLIASVVGFYNSCIEAFAPEYALLKMILKF